MKVSILQHQLIGAIKTSMRAVSGRTTLPVLTHLLFSAEDGQLVISGTNLEMVLITAAPAKVEWPGAMTVPAKTIHDLIHALPDEPISLTQEPEHNTLHVESGKTKANVKGYDKDEFPLVPPLEGKGVREFLVPVESLLGSIGRVTFSAATEDSRPTLQGVYTQFHDGKMGMAATDGFRLSESAVLLNGTQAPDDRNLLIPARTLNELSRIAGDEGNEHITVRWIEQRNQIAFSTEHVTLISQLIDGNFPDYQDIVAQAKQHKFLATVEVARLASAVKLANVFAREAAHSVKLAFDRDLAGGTITVYGESTEMGDQHSTIDAEVEGLDVGGSETLNVNARFLLDVLSVMHAPRAVLSVKSGVHPLVVSAAGDDEFGFSHVIMPMQTGR